VLVSTLMFPFVRAAAHGPHYHSHIIFYGFDIIVLRMIFLYKLLTLEDEEPLFYLYTIHTPLVIMHFTFWLKDGTYPQILFMYSFILHTLAPAI
jgi:hypothetical protein